MDHQGAIPILQEVVFQRASATVMKLEPCVDHISTKAASLGTSTRSSMINSLVMDASNTLAPDGRDILVEIKSVEVELEGANILGQVKAGSICLEGNPHTDEIWAECFVEVILVHYLDDRIVNSELIPRKHNKLHCLPIEDSSDHYRHAALEGLLLEETGALGQFRRFGTFHAMIKDVVDVIQAGLQCFDAGAEDSGLEYSDDGKGGYKYTITII